MEELLGFVGFSLGASLAIGAVRSLTEGSQPIVREAVKAGIRAWDAVAAASSAARQETAEAQATGRVRARRRSGPEKIVIAHE
jgi:hypothetical protein